MPQNGTTPLIMASQNGHKEIVDTLLGAKADPNLIDKDVSIMHVHCICFNFVIFGTFQDIMTLVNMASNSTGYIVAMFTL